MSKRRALVQDDQPMFSAPAATMLKLLGFEVDVAENGAKGLQLLASSTYDIVFTDVEMPTMNGFEFLARLRKDPKLQKLPVVICTTLSKPDHVQKAKTLGANFYIVKPMKKESLEAALKHIGLA